MPKIKVEYLDRPVRKGVTEEQKTRLRNAACRALDKNPRNTRAMLILRVNQPHVTIEEARAQAERIHRYAKRRLT